MVPLTNTRMFCGACTNAATSEKRIKATIRININSPLMVLQVQFFHRRLTVRNLNEIYVFVKISELSNRT